eukprot:351126-Chlamydomonas_euryale.AAC.12
MVITMYTHMLLPVLRHGDHDVHTCAVACATTWIITYPYLASQHTVDHCIPAPITSNTLGSQHTFDTSSPCITAHLGSQLTLHHNNIPAWITAHLASQQHTCLDHNNIPAWITTHLGSQLTLHHNNIPAWITTT